MMTNGRVEFWLFESLENILNCWKFWTFWEDDFLETKLSFEENNKTGPVQVHGVEPETRMFQGFSIEGKHHTYCSFMMIYLE